MILTNEPVAAMLPPPRWTAPSFTPTPGRYPLGIEAVNFSQLDDLASGLPVLSRHPRYWSIYTYIVRSFWDRRLTPQTNAALGRFLRLHEVVFASAALLCDRHTELPGVIGRNTIAPYLQEGRDDRRLDLAYLAQRLGGYGQVHRGAMSMPSHAWSQGCGRRKGLPLCPEQQSKPGWRNRSHPSRDEAAINGEELVCSR